jgi:hypothetical protein
MENIENQVAWFLAELCKAKNVCKKTSEISAGQSLLGVFSTPSVMWCGMHRWGEGWFN